MTTVAWRDGVLAADTLITENDRRCGFTRKIGRIGSVMWAATGCLIHQVAFNDWMRGGMSGPVPPMKTPEGASSTVILIAGDRLLTFDEHGADHMPLPDRYAVGSGAALALGAMAAGATAEQAVAAAIEHDIYSGGPITVVRRDQSPTGADPAA